MTFCRLILLASDKLARKQEGRQWVRVSLLVPAKYEKMNKEDYICSLFSRMR